MILGLGLLLGSLAFAQMGGQQGQSTQPNQPQQPAQQAQPEQQGQPQQPPAQAQPGQGQPAPAQPTGPQAKSKEEYQAYVAASQQPTLDAAEKAADDFAAKFPDSQLRAPLYRALVQKFYQAGDADKVLENAKKVLAMEPNDTMSLVMASTMLAETTRDTDLDKDQKYEQAVQYAQKAVDTVDTGLQIPPSVSPEQAQQIKNLLISMAQASMGFVEMARNNYPLSEQHFQKAVELNPSQPDPTNYLRLAVAQDKQQKYQPALENANKALEVAQQQNNSQVASLAQAEKDRLTKLAGTAAPPKK